MLKGKSKLYKHCKAQTLYLTIPASITTDSQFPFKAGDKVELSYNVVEKRLEVKK